MPDAPVDPPRPPPSRPAVGGGTALGAETDWDQRHRSTAMMYWRITRVPVLVILGWFTASHLLFGSTWVFIDYVNVLFHEAGHVLFSWGGRTLMALGGTLGQLLMPAAFAVYFLAKRKERFAGTAVIWWVGENFIGIARYMKDAPREELPLIGGDVHDWAFLFRRWGALSSADEIAGVFRFLGAATMIVTLGLLIWWTVRPRSDELEAPVE